MERYPALKYVPSFLAPWKAEVEQQRQKDIQLYTELMDEVKDKVSRGVAKECFATHLLREQANIGMGDLELAYAAGSPFGAGVETVSCPRYCATRKALLMRSVSLLGHWRASC